MKKKKTEHTALTVIPMIIITYQLSTSIDNSMTYIFSFNFFFLLLLYSAPFTYSKNNINWCKGIERNERTQAIKQTQKKKKWSDEKKDKMKNKKGK